MRCFFITLLFIGPLLGLAQQLPTVPAQAIPTARAAGATLAPKVPKMPKAAAVYKAAAPEQRAERLSQQIGKQLGLDAPTTAKIKAAALVRAQKIDAIQVGTDSNKAKNTALQTNAQDFKTALKGILTPEQFAKYTAHGAKAMAE